MSKITITVSGPVGVGKSAICAKLEILLKHLGADVEWVDGKAEANLTLEEWTAEYTVPIEIVEKVTPTQKIYETYTGPNGWQQVSQAEYDGTKHLYSHRIRREPIPEGTSADKPCIEADGCPTERAVLQYFWRAHVGRMPRVIDSLQVDELITDHSEWTPHGFAIVDSHRRKLIDDLLKLVGATTSAPVDFSKVKREPIGFMMKHRSGYDRGFSWKEDDPQFPFDWERIPLFDNAQIALALAAANADYDQRAKAWEQSFAVMHNRAIKAERQVIDSQALLDQLNQVLQPQSTSFNTPTIQFEEATDK